MKYTCIASYWISGDAKVKERLTASDIAELNSLAWERAKELHATYSLSEIEEIND